MWTSTPINFVLGIRVRLFVTFIYTTCVLTSCRDNNPDSQLVGTWGEGGSGTPVMSFSSNHKYQSYRDGYDTKWFRAIHRSGDWEIKDNQIILTALNNQMRNGDGSPYYDVDTLELIRLDKNSLIVGRKKGFNLPLQTFQRTDFDSTNIGGIISGYLSYPTDGDIPDDLKVCAEGSTGKICVGPTKDKDRFKTGVGFQISLRPGTYHVYSYIDSDTAYYDQAVVCGLTIDCKNRDKIPVIVTAGSIKDDVLPNDWYR